MNEKASFPKPIKRHRALVSWSREHHNGLLLVWKIRSGQSMNIAPGRVAAYIVHFFKEDLQKHFRDEEDYLCPLLPAEDALMLQVLEEHKVLYGLVQHIREEPSSQSLQTSFADKLEQHIRFEERVFFNHLQEHLSDVQVKGLEALERTAGEGCDAQWKDLFWLKSA
jgi:iron-sulfur cluster repair protein YtfE (RIC family)